MTTAILYRTFYEDRTCGYLIFKGTNHAPIFTLELPWLTNAQYISCIPMGQYRCIPHSGTKTGYRLENVPGRTGVLIHAGNWLVNPFTGKKQTEGCILPGMMGGKVSGFSGVGFSGNAMALIRALGGAEFMLTIQ